MDGKGPQALMQGGDEGGVETGCWGEGTEKNTYMRESMDILCECLLGWTIKHRMHINIHPPTIGSP